MADGRKRSIPSWNEEGKSKSAKTCHEEDDKDDERIKEYRVMLEKVGQCLNREALKKLSRLGSLSDYDEERIFQANDCYHSELFKILEERGKLDVNNVSCLREDLTTIGRKDAVQLIDDYLHNDRAELPSEPESDDEDRNQSCAKRFEDFLKVIGLDDRFPGKLQLEDFLNVKLNESCQNVVYSFWRRITCLDYRAGLPQSLYLHHGIECSMRDFIFSILHCAGDFLRQDILEKMSACQLAIPILLSAIRRDGSPIFLRWACGTIMKKWKGKHDSFAIEQPVISHPLFTVSFLRIGEVGVSKSELLNYMLGPNQGYGSHPYFLTKDCDKLQPRFSLGSIESVWFLPTAGSENELFMDAMTFLNLRGDCRNYPRQREFACKAANLTVVFVSTDQRRNFKDLIQVIEKMSTHTLFVSIRKRENASAKIHVNGNWIFVKRYQKESLSAHLCTEIVNICEREERKSTLNDLDMTNVDEDGKKSDVRTAKKFVDAIFRNTKYQGVITFKKENFPLQTCWKEIAKLHKKRFVFDTDDDKTFEENREERNETVKMNRSKQLKCELSNAMKKFLEAIKKSTKESSVKYFWEMLHGKIIKMVGESTNEDMEKINTLQEKRAKIMKKDSISTNQGEDERELVSISQREMENRDLANCEMLRKECKKLHECCRVNNLGCEHFLREIGQQYEAYKETSDNDLKNIDTAVFPMYPTIAAQLILQMQSFELMDGDTECVPITWVTAVLDALRLELNNPEVLVVSVIGVQSSGKSTLLNSMFGLRFPVRAGRCTRGLFMRLLKVEKNLVEDLGFKYLIVVDTEGLRSIDHDDHTFDNELVTFALSIANVTIFNISGENISADVAGVLQIAAHALMRMKEVDLECKCLIIQQRVSDLTAADRNKPSTHKLKETLNEATRFAAEEEGLEGRYKEFSDVVDLKFDEDLQYVPNLWAGGMAPPNHMYGEKVTKIRESLLQDIKKGKIKADLTLSTFTDRIRDVWSAVKQENFIFNFQDSVRAVDFNQFCLQYNRWIVEMRQAIMNESLMCLLKIPLLICRGDDIESLKSSLDDEEDRQGKLLRKNVEDHIANHSRKVMISKYKQGFLDDMNIALKDAKHQALQWISEEYDIRKLEHNLPRLGGNWLVRMITDVKELAQQIRTTREHTDVQNVTYRHIELYGSSTYSFGDSSIYAKELNELWKKWTKHIKNESGISQINITPSDIKTLCDKLLFRMTRDMAVGSEIHNLFEREGGIEEHIGLVDFRKYINDKQVKAWIRSKQKSAKSDRLSCESEQAISEIDQINIEKDKAVAFMQTCVENSVFELKQQARNHFDRNVFQLLVRKTLKNLSEKTDDIKLPHSLIAKGLMYLCGRAFEEVFRHIEIKNDNFRIFFLNEDYMASTQLFRFIFQKDIEYSASEFLFYYMEQDLKTQFKKCTMESMKCKAKERLDLPWDVLEDCGMSPQYYLAYLWRQEISLSILLEFSFEQEFRNHSMLTSQVIRDERDRLRTMYIHKLINLEQESGQNVSFIGWIDRLIKTLSIDSSVQNAVNLYDGAQPLEVSRHLRDRISDWIPPNAYNVNFDWVSRKIAVASTSRCNKTCPMCGMFCGNTMKSHTIHSSHLHRPRGMTGETYPGTNQLVLEDCSTSVLLPNAISVRSGKMFYCKDYKQHYPEWIIPPYRNNPGKTFWRWCFVQFAKSFHNDDLIIVESMNYINYEKYYMKFPNSWLKITMAEALQSLNDDKKLKIEGRKRETQSEEANPVVFANASSESETSVVESENSHSDEDSDMRSDVSTEEESRNSGSSLDEETFSQD